MKRKAGQTLAWLAATAASILLATSAVSSVRDEVTTQPSPLRVPAPTIAAQPAAATTTATEVPLPAVTETPATVAPSTTASPTAPGSTTATSTAPTTTMRPPETSSTTTTTTTTSTTTAPDDEYFESYQLIGGWVRLRVIGDQVFLAGTVPSPGFSLEIEKDGPKAVKVEFSSNDHESKLQAEVSDGELEVETSEEEED